jgi:hypothetical protein
MRKERLEKAEQAEKEASRLKNEATKGMVS